MTNAQEMMRRMTAGRLDDYLKKEETLSYGELVQYVRVLGFFDPPEIYYQKLVKKYLYDSLTPEEVELLKTGKPVQKEEKLPSGRVVTGKINPLTTFI